MNSTLLPLVRFSLATVACLTTFFFMPTAAAAADEDLGQPFGIVLVPAGRSVTEVRAAVVNALVGRQWVIMSQADDRVVANIKHRGDDATLTMVYNPAEISLFCTGWHLNKTTGAHEKLAHVAGWTVSLRKDLTKALGSTNGTKK